MHEIFTGLISNCYLSLDFLFFVVSGSVIIFRDGSLVQQKTFFLDQ